MDFLIKLPLKNPEKILIIKPSSLGDVVHSLPFLNAITTRFPNADIHWVIAEGLEGLLEGHPMIDNLWIIRKDGWKKIKNAKDTIEEIRNLFKNLKKEKFDIVTDLQGLLRSGIITSATGSAVRIGFTEAREGSKFFYTHRVKGGKNIHAVVRYLKIAEFLGCDISDIRFPFPSFKKSLSFGLSPSERYAVFVPGARWRTKQWPSERFGKLSSLLSIRTIIIGSKTDINIANKIVDLSKGKAISLAGKTNLKELIGVMRGARFVVSNDSGPMHVAAALGVPVFALFGPTDSQRTCPYGEGHTVIKEEIQCSPCFKRTCNDLECMKSISVEKVYEAIKLSFS